MEQNNDSTDFLQIHVLSIQRMLSDILLTSALTLCETYILATQKFRQNRDHVAYKRSLFAHDGKLHHADIDYHCACHGTRLEESRCAIRTSTFIDRCALAASHAYNIHSYVDASRQENSGPNTFPLTDLIHRMMQSISVLYTPLILPPDIVDNTKPAANCRVCSKNTIIRGTMALSGQEAVCSCTTSVYRGTNADGGRHASLTVARHILFDTTQRSMCIQAPMCECRIHNDAFVSIVTQLVHALTGETRCLPTVACPTHIQSSSPT